MRLPNGQEYYYLPRELYSVAALTDETASIVEAATYDTYGQVAVYNGSAQAVEESPAGNPYYFTGRELDLLPTVHSPQPAAKQLYHYRARAYDPGNGRFLERDRACGAPLTLYEYVNSSPARFTDPSGLALEFPPPEGPSQGVLASDSPGCPASVRSDLDAVCTMVDRLMRDLLQQYVGLKCTCNRKEVLLGWIATLYGMAGVCQAGGPNLSGLYVTCPADGDPDCAGNDAMFQTNWTGLVWSRIKLCPSYFQVPGAPQPGIPSRLSVLAHELSHAVGTDDGVEGVQSGPGQSPYEIEALLGQCYTLVRQGGQCSWLGMGTRFSNRGGVSAARDS